MHLEYTPEEIRALVAEGGVLNYEAATAADAAEATDVLEGVEELIAKLEPAVRREALASVALETGDELWVPVAHNCRRSCGIAVSPEGFLSFAVKGAGENLVTYFAARQAASHALSGRAVVDGTILPHPEENGPTIPNLSIVDLGDGSEGPAEDVADDEDFLGAPASPDERETGAVDFALKGLAGDEPSDLAAEGLGYPEGVSVRYLGRQGNGGGAFDVAASFAPSSAGEYTPEEPELRPDWRERLEDLRGELPADLLDDAAALLEETSEASAGSFARPGEFFAELTRRRAVASLTTEDLDAHRQAERLGALDPAPLEAGMMGRLSTAGRAHLRTISGQLLLVPVGSPTELVTEAAERSRFARLEEQ